MPASWDLEHWYSSQSMRADNHPKYPRLELASEGLQTIATEVLISMTELRYRMVCNYCQVLP